MTTVPATRRGPGRPRPAATIARDELIYDLVQQQPRARGALTTATGLSGSIVHASLKRLHLAERVRQCADGGAIVWSVNDGTPCP